MHFIIIEQTQHTCDIELKRHNASSIECLVNTMLYTGNCHDNMHNVVVHTLMTTAASIQEIRYEANASECFRHHYFVLHAFVVHSMVLHLANLNCIML